MKVLIVDDAEDFVQQIVEILKEAGIEAEGLSPHNLDSAWFINGPTSDHVTGNDYREVVKRADVIFLDHNMVPGQNGEQWLQFWLHQGVDFSTKRVIGISSDYQSYLKERISRGMQTVEEIKKKIGEITST